MSVVVWVNEIGFIKSKGTRMTRIRRMCTDLGLLNQIFFHVIRKYHSLKFWDFGKNSITVRLLYLWLLDMNNQKTNRPNLIVPENTKLFAHTYADNLNAIGTIEPVVGRETDQLTGNFGKNCSSAQISWTPESKVIEKVSIQIEKKGLWRKFD